MNRKNFLITKARITKTSRYENDMEEQDLFFKMNRALQPVEFEAISSLKDFSRTPIVFISYLPRSGSSLLSQLLILTKKFNYISNFQSRFWLAPFLGGVLENSLCDKFKEKVTCNSDYGLTEKLFEPSEFTYLWEHWLNLSEKKSHALSHSEARKIKMTLLVKEMNALRSLSTYPLLFKKEWLGMNAGILLDNIPNSRFIHLDRNSNDLAISILKARQDVFGDVKSWWAAKPSNYTKLSKLDSYKQVAGQIAGIRKDIEKWIKLYPDKFLCLKYESLISDVHKHVTMIAEFTGIKIAKKDLKNLPERISLKRTNQSLRHSKSKKILEALKEFGLNG